jgi:predicted acylesterase/phospholipase RssA
LLLVSCCNTRSYSLSICFVEDKHGVVRSQEGETFFDGSIEQDIPINGLAEMLNCQFFIACQYNPHIVPFFYNSKGGVGRPSRWSSGTQEDSWRGGFLLAALEMYLKNDMKAKMRYV